MSVASRFECGSGEDAYETVNPANPSEKVGRYAIMGSDELGAVIERANAAERERARARAGTIATAERLHRRG